MQSATDLVSVIIPAYNAARYLEAALDSVRRQTHRNLEVIVVDDGSTDGTPALLKAVSESDARVRTVRQERKGVAAARNLAISSAKGEWIAPLDADDVWNPFKIEKQLAAVERGSGEVGLVYTWTQYIDEMDRPVGELRAPWEGAVLIPLVLCNFVGHASAPLISRSALDKVGGFDTHFYSQSAQGCEDWDLYLRLARWLPFRVVRECLTGYRIINQAMSRQHPAMERSYGLMVQKLKADLPRVPEFLLRWSESQFYMYLEGIAMANGDHIYARRAWLRSCYLNPARLLQPATYGRLWNRLPSFIQGAVSKWTSLEQQGSRRWDGRASARLYDWCEDQMLIRAQAHWRKSNSLAPG